MSPKLNEHKFYAILNVFAKQNIIKIRMNADAMSRISLNFDDFSFKIMYKLYIISTKPNKIKNSLTK